MIDWIMRWLFPGKVAERDAQLAALDREIERARARLRQHDEKVREGKS